MAFLDGIKAFFLILRHSIQQFFSGDIAFSSKILRQLSIAIMVLILGAGGYVGHRWYVVNREQAAHYAFADYMYDYQAALKAENPQEWSRIDSLLEYGYAQHKNSAIAPLFLALRADVQIKQNNPAQAAPTLQQAVQGLPKNSLVAPLFKTKRALLLIDNQDEALQKVGLEELVALARDKDNQYNDMALFYLGRYYWAHNTIDEAKKVWQELIDGSALNQAYPSPWVQEAYALL